MVELSSDWPAVTSAVSSVPVCLSVASKPDAIASSATSTATTPAVPTTTTDAAPRRCGKVEMPKEATDPVNRPLRVDAIHATNKAATGSSSHQGIATSAVTGTAIASSNKTPNATLLSAVISAPRQCVDDLQPHAAQR